ncbi:hypothetical protein SLA2020_063800, partial [Shorea laevis]
MICYPSSPLPRAALGVGVDFRFSAPLTARTGLAAGKILVVRPDAREPGERRVRRLA